MFASVPTPRLRRWIPAAFVLLYLLLLGMTSFRPIKENDFWWHIKAGEVMWSNREILSVDPFSHTAQGIPWTPYEWGSQLILYAISHFGGLAGARLLAAGLVVILALVQFVWIGRRQSWPLAFLGMLLTVEFALSRLTPRPALFTALFAVTLPLLLEWAARDLTWRKGAALAAFLTLWINLHPEALAGIGLSALYFAVRMTSAPREERRKLGMFCLGLAATALLQPQGLSLIGTAFVDSREGMRRVHEWQATLPALVGSGQVKTLICLGLAWIVGFGVAWSRRKTIPREELLISLLSGVLALTAVREIFWMALPVGYTFRWLPRRQIRAMAAAAVVGTALVSLPWKYFHPEYWATDVAEEYFPVAQADFIEREGLKGNLFNFYDNGGYLIYRLYPRCKVFIDPRQTPFSREIFRAHDAILYGAPDAQKYLDLYHVDLLLIRSSYFSDPEHHPIWRRAFTDGHYDVYVRRPN